MADAEESATVGADQRSPAYFEEREGRFLQALADFQDPDQEPTSASFGRAQTRTRPIVLRVRALRMEGLQGRPCGC
jgi:hypothetical protein